MNMLINRGCNRLVTRSNDSKGGYTPLPCLSARSAQAVRRPCPKTICGALDNEAQSGAPDKSKQHSTRPDVSRRQLINMTMGATMTFFGCPCCKELGQAKADDSFGYSTNVIVTGPSYWPGTCSTGVRQSPVNLPIRDQNHQNSPGFTDLVFKYADVDSIFVSNPGHGSMQLNFSPGKIVKINNEDHELLQYHFHTPSEHAFDGERFAMEAHLVHKSKRTGDLAVIGIMLEPEGQPNPCVEVGLVYAPQPGDRINLKERVDPMMLLPEPNKDGHRAYVHYSGSLTTPPCSEYVNWFVMTEPVQISDRQILRFMNFVGGQRSFGQNARPLNPLLQREVFYDL